MTELRFSEGFVLRQIPCIVDDFQTVNLLVNIRFQTKNKPIIKYAFLLLLSIDALVA